MRYFFVLMATAFSFLVNAADSLPDTRQGAISILDNNGHAVTEYVTFINHNGIAVFEGDIVIGYTDEVENANPVFTGDFYKPFSMYSNVIGRKWPSSIPYMFDTALTSENTANIIQVMRQLETIANINFVPRSNQGDYLYFELTNDDAVCGRSAVGKQGGRQSVWLHRSCIYANSPTVFHEVLHALGFWHEHTRPDRDDFVTVHWDNIPTLQQHNFNKLTANIAVSGAYDYSSIMHYFASAWGKIVLSAKSPSSPSLGGYFLSAGDINGLIELYGERPRAPYVSRVAVEWVGCTSGWYARGLMEWTNLGGGAVYQLEKKQGYHWYRVYTGTLPLFTIGESVGTTMHYRVRAVDGQSEGSWFNLSQYVPCRAGH
jgi:hypothetical protein